MPLAALHTYDHKYDALHLALLDLGADLRKRGGIVIDASFISAPESIRDNILATLPEQTGPEESLFLLAQDIEEHLHAASHNLHTDFFGLALTNAPNAEIRSPYALLYDLELGAKVIPVSPDIMASGPAILVEYQPLDSDDADRYLRVEETRQDLIAQDQTLDKLLEWEKNFRRMLALAQADAATTMDAQTSLLGLLNQGRAMAASLAAAKNLSGHARKLQARAATEKMQGAIAQRLATGGLPEILRKALRVSLGGLREAAQRKPAAWLPKQKIGGVAALRATSKAAVLKSFRTAANSNLIRLPTARFVAHASINGPVKTSGKPADIVSLGVGPRLSPSLSGISRTMGEAAPREAPSSPLPEKASLAVTAEASPLTKQNNAAPTPEIKNADTPVQEVRPTASAAENIVQNTEILESKTQPQSQQARIVSPEVPSVGIPLVRQEHVATETQSTPPLIVPPPVVTTPNNSPAPEQPPLPALSPAAGEKPGDPVNLAQLPIDKRQPDAQPADPSRPDTEKPAGLLDELRRADADIVKEFHGEGCSCCSPAAKAENAAPSNSPNASPLPTILETYAEQTVALKSDDGKTVNFVAAFSADSGKQATTMSTDDLLKDLERTLSVTPDPPLCRVSGQVGCTCGISPEAKL